MVDYLNVAIKAAIAAGDVILKIYEDDIAVRYKADESPLTKADYDSNVIIKNLLGNQFPILSEEDKTLPYVEREKWNIFWLIDPLDGTKEFIKKNGEFTVNIALIKDGEPVLGVVFAPALNLLYFACEGLGSYKYDKPLKIADLPESKDLIKESLRLYNSPLPNIYTIVASRSHVSAETEAFITKCKLEFGEIELLNKGSSIKLCLVAEGKANIYPRIAPTMEWDTAAAHAVAKFAGCEVLDFYKRTELVYNKKDLLNPFFIVIH